MRTKAFLLICLFIGIGITQLSAQNGKNGTGADPYYYEYYLVLPVDCGGEAIDILQGEVIEHGRPYYREGELIRQNTRTDGELTGTKEDADGVLETFKLNDIFKWDSSQNMGHVNLVGNQGSHYILTYTWGSGGPEILGIFCPGSK